MAPTRFDGTRLSAPPRATLLLLLRPPRLSTTTPSSSACLVRVMHRRRRSGSLASSVRRSRRDPVAGSTRSRTARCRSPCSPPMSGRVARRGRPRYSIEVVSGRRRARPSTVSIACNRTYGSSHGVGGVGGGGGGGWWGVVVGWVLGVVVVRWWVLGGLGGWVGGGWVVLPPWGLWVGPLSTTSSHWAEHAVPASQRIARMLCRPPVEVRSFAVVPTASP